MVKGDIFYKLVVFKENNSSDAKSTLSAIIIISFTMRKVKYFFFYWTLLSPNITVSVRGFVFFFSEKALKM